MRVSASVDSRGGSWVCACRGLCWGGSGGYYLQKQLTDGWGSGGERCQEGRLLQGI